MVVVALTQVSGASYACLSGFQVGLHFGQDSFPVANKLQRAKGFRLQTKSCVRFSTVCYLRVAFACEQWRASGARCSKFNAEEESERTNERGKNRTSAKQRRDGKRRCC